MTFGYRLRARREELNMTQSQLAEILGVTKGSIGNYENGVSSPNETVLLKLFNALGVEPNYLFQDSFSKDISDSPLDIIEKDIIKKYRVIRENDTVLDLLINFINNAYSIEVSNKKRFFRELPVYTQPATAGDGNFLTDDSFELVKVGDDVPQQANFGVHVSGDSMEPLIRNGSLVWVKQQPYIEHKQIGIFLLNGDSYIKQWDEKTHSLISINDEYSPIIIGEYDDLRVFGRVLITK